MLFQCAPKTEQELLERCQKIAGLTLGELAMLVRQQTHTLENPALKAYSTVSSSDSDHNEPFRQKQYDLHTLPDSLLQAKGWIGQLIEFHLGAEAKSQPVPDFQNLGIELKTLPITENLKPIESTYVCTTPMSLERDVHWETSRVFQKIQRVLWIPIITTNTLSLADRRVGSALLWSPDSETMKILKQDWEDLMEMLMLGHAHELTAHYGIYLQVRPKAAHGRILKATLDSRGEKTWTGPKGFYLRTTLTQKILSAHYA